nr:putative thiazole-containing bacteriocin maturation protein [Paenibacillus baekrokdamisoli]
MRLKVKGDTFFLPNPDGGVYFRNNVGSFRMEGSTIDQWIEKLIPVFNGEHTMEDLTDGLPDQYREQVYGIAEVLYVNGFVRDVSQDRPHHLPDGVLQKYASQIEFLDSFGGSGAYRLQLYRQAKVLAVGSGNFFVSLIKSLLESGLPQFRMLITDSETTNRQRLSELVENVHKTDPEIDVLEVNLPKEGGMDWREVIQPFDLILYVSHESGIGELKALHAVCKEEKKVLLPAMFMQQAGLAGPLIHPDSDGCLESAWRRIHHSALCKNPQLQTISSTSEAMLANVIVFETLKTVTEVTVSELKNKLFLLNLETLEGSWHTFLPHPLVNGCPAVEWIEDFEMGLERSPRQKESDGLIPFFSRLTSMETGVFHNWEEGDLKQLPLSQCRVQAADPLSEGPTELLPEIICNGLKHDEARREAGLAGIEAYVSRMAGMLVTALPVHSGSGSSVEPQSFEFVGVGAGETVAEGACRGLQKYLAEELRRRLATREPSVNRVQLSTIEDKRCRYYLYVLTAMQGVSAIGLGEEVSGFPVIWVGTNGCWYGAVDLNLTMALRRALQQALLKAQNKEAYLVMQAMEITSVIEREEAAQSISIPACEESGEEKVLQTALQILKRNGKRLLVCDLASESFLKEELAGVFGVLLREEESH